MRSHGRKRSRLDQKATGTPSWLLRGAALVGLLTLLPMVSQSAKIALSGLYNSHVASFMEHWRSSIATSQGPFYIPAHELETAINSSEKVLKLVPKGNDALAHRLKLYEWERKYFEQPAVDRQAERALYRQALSLRPAWPYLYLDYAQSYTLQKNLGEEFQYSVLQAANLGPWEARVQEQLAIFRFHYQGWFNPVTQEAVNKNLQRIALARPGKALRIAARYNAEDEVCELILDSHRYKPCR